MKIAILGAGAFGTALGGILTNNGHEIEYYDSFLEKKKLSDVLSGKELILLSVPSKVVPYLLPHLPKNKPLIVATKGILSDKIFIGFRDYMVISGPGFADDIKNKKKTEFTVTDKRLFDLFKGDYITFDYTEDKKGVLMCGALKNVYAILAGLLGLKRGTKEWEEYTSKASNEMREILNFNGARGETVDLVCGIGDLKLTCGYPSRNYEFGDRFRMNPNYKVEKTVEGLSALKRIRRHEIKVPDSADDLRTLIKDSHRFFK